MPTVPPEAANEGLDVDQQQSVWLYAHHTHTHTRFCPVAVKISAQRRRHSISFMNYRFLLLNRAKFSLSGNFWVRVTIGPRLQEQ
jgi:hypothetical protein